MRVWIRADGNEQIASGHLRRCLTIAEELVKRGAEVQFILADSASERMLQKIMQGEDEAYGIGRTVLGIPYAHLMEELFRIEQYSVKEQKPESCGVNGTAQQGAGRPDWILVDSYAADQNYFDKLYRIFPGVKIACIDDMMAFDPAVDLVINYDPDPAELEKFYHAAKEKLLGPAYVPLRREFRSDANTEFQEKASASPDDGQVDPDADRGIGPAREGGVRILISIGGSDPFGLSDRLSTIVRRTVALSWSERNGITADTADVTPEITVAAPGYPYITDMAEVMRNSDLAISAAGTTLYELCAVGGPSVSFSMADNQEIFAKKMDRVGAIPYAGDVRTAESRSRTLEKIADWLHQQLQTMSAEPAAVLSGIRNDPAWRQQSVRMRSLVDGRGAERIAEALLHMQQNTRQ